MILKGVQCFIAGIMKIENIQTMLVRVGWVKFATYGNCKSATDDKATSSGEDLKNVFFTLLLLSLFLFCLCETIYVKRFKDKSFVIFFITTHI